MTRRTARPDPQPGIAARFDDDCPRCDDPILRNDRIVFSRGHAIHVRCASGQDES